MSVEPCPSSDQSSSSSPRGIAIQHVEDQAEAVAVPGLPSGLLQHGSFAGSWVESKGKELVGLARLGSAPLGSAPLESFGVGEGCEGGCNVGND